MSFALDTYGALHYAVNNAGIGGAAAPTGEVDIAEWNRVIAINLNGVLYGMRYQIPAMLKAGAGQCAIVNMASIHGAVAAPGNSAYTAAKHGVVGLARAYRVPTELSRLWSLLRVSASSRPSLTARRVQPAPPPLPPMKLFM